MKFRGLDSNNDWQFGQGLGSYAKDQDAIALNMKTRRLSRVGNCFFDPGAGVDWKVRLDKGQEADLKLDIDTVLIQTDGVIRINSSSLILDRDTRKISVRYDVQTIFTQSFVTTLAAITGDING